MNIRVVLNSIAITVCLSLYGQMLSAQESSIEVSKFRYGVGQGFINSEYRLDYAEEDLFMYNYSAVLDFFISGKGYDIEYTTNFGTFNRLRLDLKACRDLYIRCSGKSIDMGSEYNYLYSDANYYSDYSGVSSSGSYLKTVSIGPLYKFAMLKRRLSILAGVYGGACFIPELETISYHEGVDSNRLSRLTTTVGYDPVVVLALEGGLEYDFIKEPKRCALKGQVIISSDLGGVDVDRTKVMEEWVDGNIIYETPSENFRGKLRSTSVEFKVIFLFNRI